MDEYRTQQMKITRPTIDSASKVGFASVSPPVPGLVPLVCGMKLGLQVGSKNSSLVDDLCFLIELKYLAGSTWQTKSSRECTD